MSNYKIELDPVYISGVEYNFMQSMRFLIDLARVFMTEQGNRFQKESYCVDLLLSLESQSFYFQNENGRDQTCHIGTLNNTKQITLFQQKYEEMIFFL